MNPSEQLRSETDRFTAFLTNRRKSDVILLCVSASGVVGRRPYPFCFKVTNSWRRFVSQQPFNHETITMRTYRAK
jgi:hypothetical protein